MLSYPKSQPQAAIRRKLLAPPRASRNRVAQEWQRPAPRLLPHRSRPHRRTCSPHRFRACRAAWGLIYRHFGAANRWIAVGRRTRPRLPPTRGLDPAGLGRPRPRPAHRRRRRALAAGPPARRPPAQPAGFIETAVRPFPRRHRPRRKRAGPRRRDRLSRLPQPQLQSAGKPIGAFRFRLIARAAASARLRARRRQCRTTPQAQCQVRSRMGGDRCVS